MANQLAVHVPELKAAIPFYGRQPEAVDVPRIKAALLLHYAGMDKRINAGIPAYEEALKKAGISYQLFTYDRAQHAFHNDTTLRDTTSRLPNWRGPEALISSKRN